MGAGHTSGVKIEMDGEKCSVDSVRGVKWVSINMVINIPYRIGLSIYKRTSKESHMAGRPRGSRQLRKHAATRGLANRRNVRSLKVVCNIVGDDDGGELRGKNIDRELQEMRKADGEGPANLRKDCVKIRLLGRGSGGAVYLGIYVPTLTLVAIKEISVSGMKVLQDRIRTAHGNSSLNTRTTTSAAILELHALHKNLVPLTSTGESTWLFHYHESIGEVIHQG